MNTAQMPRKNAGYRLDDRCIDALKVLATRTGVSVNEYLEKLLFEHAKVHGVIPSKEGRLGETRGRRKASSPETSVEVGTGKKKRSPNNPADTEDSLSDDGDGSAESRSPADVDAIGDEPDHTS